ncbi:hypothetical protein IQ241_23560 [Romeria aff. gracilis LEGE 07310]|uniref:Zinc ribbon domain-containing protein n=1 Tax=Vasconcelosia minhoensis LEGE 07310 TaxID=915328 RepID=A0A8J7DEZ6_9CYAN|nr:hypothetical protein [Romeria gracilis]MBE9080228.1 hypothetical protein [Romeria aff. gracilis LEGE 07310]
MLNRLRCRLRRFFYKSRTVNDEPINKVSLIVIVLVDIFILVNVFIGLNDIGQWYISPTQAYDCYPEWQSYRSSTADLKDYNTVRDALLEQNSNFQRQDRYRQLNDRHLGSVSAICQQYASYQDALSTPESRAILDQIDGIQAEIAALEAANQTIRQQYDSTLLEEIAGQPRDQSINAVEAAQARQTLETNEGKIADFKAAQSELRSQLLASAESDRFLQYLNEDSSFQTLERRYQRARFWYPSIQILFQGIFLVPLIFMASAVHRYGQRRGYGLVSLISWHLLAIFCIPLIVKVFQFLQAGFLFEVLSEAIAALLGGLLFLLTYLYILIIPLIGFGIIKFFQRVVFNPKVQAAGRVQKGNCIRCAKKIRREDAHCPHCGFYQFVECPNCHDSTYKHLPYCRECGTPQEPNPT